MIRLAACAKVNFYLEITGKRADGYHTLSTVFQTISLCDQLSFEPSAELAMSCSDATLATDHTNLVMKAATRLREQLGEKRGARIHLEKKVPMGAGLGGGSSDAAAVLKGLLKLWRRRMEGPALKRLAVSLGADVPFFLKGGCAYAEGIGDHLRRLKPLPKTWMVIVWPGFGVSTKEAYARVRLPFGHPAIPRSVDPRANLFNRFEDLVFPDYPALPMLKQEILNAGATAAMMSGSGSAIFGLVKSQAQGAKVLQQLQSQYPHAWLVHTN